MLSGGEDPLFIARRMLILASEDVGLANPNAALLAQSCFDAVHKIGMPESRIILAQTCIYLATSPKSNSAYMAIDEAMADVYKRQILSRASFAPISSVAAAALSSKPFASFLILEISLVTSSV